MPDKYLSPELQDWTKLARKFQQSQYDALGDRDWDCIDIKKHLQLKIGFALYGPTFVTENDTKQTEQVNIIKTHVVKLWNKIKVPNDIDKSKIFFSSVFIYLRLFDNDGCTKNEGIDVLFKIRKEFDNYSRSSRCLFIDRSCRTYDGFDDYLENNKLPECDICYPRGGVYSARNGVVEVDFIESPACSISKKILSGLDITSSVLAVGATAVGLASLAVPVAAPVVWCALGTFAGAGTYDATRKIVKLVDLAEHEESLGFENSEAREAWIGLAASAAGVASAGATAWASRAVAEAGVISRNAAIALRTCNISSLAITGVGIVNNLITVVIKFINGNLGKLDLLEFINACFFFLNAVVSETLARNLIRDIASTDFFFQFSSARTSSYSFTKLAVEFSDSSYNALRCLLLGKNSVLMPNIDFKCIHKTTIELFSLVDQLYAGSIGWEKFCMEISKNFNSWYQKKECILESIKRLMNHFKIDWSSYKMKKGYQPLANNPDIARKFYLIISQMVDKIGLDEEASLVSEDILSLIDNFNHNCDKDISNNSGFLFLTKFICDKFIDRFNVIREDYESIRNQNYDDYKKRNMAYFRTAMAKLNSTESFKLLDPEFKKTFPTNISSQQMDERFQHDIFSGPPGQKTLKDEEYFKKAQDFTDCRLDDNNSLILVQDGCVVIQPIEENTQIKTVIFYSSYELNCVMGVMAVIRN